MRSFNAEKSLKLSGTKKNSALKKLGKNTVKTIKRGLNQYHHQRVISKGAAQVQLFREFKFDNASSLVLL